MPYREVPATGWRRKHGHGAKRENAASPWILHLARRRPGKRFPPQDGGIGTIASSGKRFGVVESELTCYRLRVLALEASPNVGHMASPAPPPPVGFAACPRQRGQHMPTTGLTEPQVSATLWLLYPARQFLYANTQTAPATVCRLPEPFRYRTSRFEQPAQTTDSTSWFIQPNQPAGSTGRNQSDEPTITTRRTAAQRRPEWRFGMRNGALLVLEWRRCGPSVLP